MKYVREHINEKFTADSDPLHDMGIGPKGIVDELKKKYHWSDYDIFIKMLSEEKDVEKAKTVMDYLLENTKLKTDIDDKWLAQGIIHHANRDIMRHYVVEKAIEYKAKKALAEFLIQASKWNDTDLIIKLVNGGADPRIRGNKPMMLAIRHRNKKVWDIMEPHIKWKK